jgi:hypothetical protein
MAAHTGLTQDVDAMAIGDQRSIMSGEGEGGYDFRRSEALLLASQDEEMDELKEVKVEPVEKSKVVVCGYWAQKVHAHIKPLCEKYEYKKENYSTASGARRACLTHMRHCRDNSDARICAFEGCQTSVQKANMTMCAKHLNVKVPVVAKPMPVVVSGPVVADSDLKVEVAALKTGMNQIAEEVKLLSEAIIRMTTAEGGVRKAAKKSVEYDDEEEEEEEDA